MADTFTDRVINEVLEVEGSKYTNDPADRGGPTRWGITLATLTKYRNKPTTAEDVKALSREEAFQIYRTKYILEPKFNLIEAKSNAIAAELVDTGVNMGPATAAKFLQRTLNALNNNLSYPALSVDGLIGPATANALGKVLELRGKQGEEVVIATLNGLQTARYVELTEGNPSQKKFFYGWMTHRVVSQLKRLLSD